MCAVFFSQIAPGKFNLIHEESMVVHELCVEVYVTAIAFTICTLSQPIKGNDANVALPLI